MNIDFKLLSIQKLELVNLSSQFNQPEAINKTGFLNKKQSDALDGVIGLIDAIQDQQEDKFPNGFKNWVETHHVIVENITLILNKSEDEWTQKVFDAQSNEGTGGIWKLCEDLTDKFEQENIGVEWDGEWFEAIDAFLEKELA